MTEVRRLEIINWFNRASRAFGDVATLVAADCNRWALDWETKTMYLFKATTPENVPKSSTGALLLTGVIRTRALLETRVMQYFKRGFQIKGWAPEEDEDE